MTALLQRIGEHVGGWLYVIAAALAFGEAAVLLGMVLPGETAVLLGRLTAVLRALVPSMAGMARMPFYRTFLPWNAAGGVLWATSCVLLGYGFAASLHTVERYLTWGPIPVLVLVAAILAALEIRRHRRERTEAAEFAAAAATGGSED